MFSRWSFSPAAHLLVSLIVTAAVPSLAAAQFAGESVNMVSGTQWPGGDPFLQRQNEPSIAVSSANPMHLLAGANDYRTVDVPFVPGATKMPADAWQGVFKSYDGGQTWKSYLMPGYPQDTSFDGRSSAVRGPNGQVLYNASADPVVRAGTDGMFYFAGIVFARGTNDGRVVLNRFIDLNDKENGDPVGGTDSIQWVDASVIDQGGAWFADKPWIAVDVPRAGALDLHGREEGRQRPGALPAHLPRRRPLRGLGPHPLRHPVRRDVLALARLRRHLEHAAQAERRQQPGQPGGGPVGGPPHRRRLRGVAPLRRGHAPTPRRTTPSSRRARSARATSSPARGCSRRSRPSTSTRIRRGGASAPRRSPPSRRRSTRRGPRAGPTWPGPSEARTATARSWSAWSR